MSDIPALKLEGVRAGYGRIEVLHGVDLSVPKASVLALLGPNGAGKTTTLKVACGRMRPTAGGVWHADTAVPTRAPDGLARKGVCIIPEGRGVFPNLSVTENLRMWTYRGRVSRSEVEERAFGRFPRLRDRRGQLAGTLSGGEQQMLAISRALTTDPTFLLLDEISMGLAPIVVAERQASTLSTGMARLVELGRALATRPKLLLLDEPSSGLDQSETDTLGKLLSALAGEGIAVLLVEHDVELVMRVCDQVYVLDFGQIIAAGNPVEVQADPRVQLAYLGADVGTEPPAPDSGAGVGG